MNFKNLSLVFAVAILSVFTSCSKVDNVLNFINCEYEFQGVSNPVLAGVPISNITSIDQINPLSLIMLAASIAQGKLPISADVNVKATNPNSSPAEIERLEWALDLDNKEVLTGVVDHRISVPANGGSTLIPFTFQIDIFQLIKDGSQNDLLNLALNFANAGDGNSRVGIRIKPTVMVGNIPITSGFISIGKTKTSN